MDQPRYQHCRWIGAGAFSKVYRAIDTKINCVVALKLTELEGDGNDGGVPAVSLREMSVLKEMHHENIIKLLDVVHQDGKRLTLVFEFMDGDLLEFMKARPDRFSDSNLIKRSLLKNEVGGDSFAKYVNEGMDFDLRVQESIFFHVQGYS
ncbi:hypothetical protein POTOM_030741 [Populus tomentosa]|uniref:cyclin-dependent kinase n=1 Tax=Populus tomentosa TaxID=118781 RepID=A0A8X8CR93_POPTO|nr:hypothetical protein POTOM_030741 [Populus tomentosa]